MTTVANTYVKGNIRYFESDNPEWLWEMYDLETGLFLGYYKSRHWEGKKRRSRVAVVGRASDFPRCGEI